MSCKDCKDKEIFDSLFEEKIPYTDVIDNGKVIRTFRKDTPGHLLKWHWDEEDREVTSLNETDWQFQFDNQLPQQIKGSIKIPKGVYHRIIKGTGDLKLCIFKK